MTDQYLTVSDLQALLADPSPEHQAEAAAKVAQAWRQGTLDPMAREAAETLFRTIARRATVAVRAALAEAMKDADTLPHDVAIKLASDVDHVALPILEASSVLTDEDLAGLVGMVSAAGMSVIAGRPALSETVAGALIERGNEAAIARLMGNPTAQISEEALQVAADRHGHSAAVAEPMAGRTGLPARVAARLMSVVAEQLQRHLLGRDAIDPDLLSDLILQGRERATLVLAHGVGPDLEGFISDLNRSGRLTPTLVLRSLLTGDYLFFETALASRAGIPAANAAMLVRDPGGSGLTRLFAVAGMPESQLALARVALFAAEETELRDAPDARNQYRSLVIERILTGFGDRVDTASVDYMITKIGHGSPVASAAAP
ncbi:DUF2336 domain-containing protein [Zavarzinia sp.]|uniref:DUF2336 domain-containing protein n=1 Tax=Zavarzinia sp. TaxID=2027920 RepID=UPI003BB78D18|nr:DUF2336 domain-containing protein [Zavarzinia sp.]